MFPLPLLHHLFCQPAVVIHNYQVHGPSLDKILTENLRFKACTHLFILLLHNYYSKLNHWFFLWALKQKRRGTATKKPFKKELLCKHVTSLPHVLQSKSFLWQGVVQSWRGNIWVMNQFYKSCKSWVSKEEQCFSLNNIVDLPHQGHGIKGWVLQLQQDWPVARLILDIPPVNDKSEKKNYLM